MFNNTIRGKFDDKEFWYSSVEIKKCDGTQNITCANENEIDNFFAKNNKISAPFTDMFIDISVIEKGAREVVKPHI